ncbi:GmrSD restriction endonuclease domain-containing protein [Gordonia hydrophobica]|uniref:DUF1524 domain-containing protein n=1 Tax=Gordonia hydrophobica TaxID=40516 RepID=A0ABZ2U2V5_9ACTN|nr:DUF1524 domain-containing protein [Gordonia hydrophobica]MBM7367338.1 hypothetical protein [Gordonia hydrophobica]
MSVSLRRSLIGRSHAVGLSAVGAAAAVLITGCSPASDTAVTSAASAVTDRGDIAWSSTAPPASTSMSSSAAPSTKALSAASTAALAALATLPVKGRAPKTGYDRALFGQAWSDDVSVEFGHNGCDTRNDILKRDLTDLTFKPRTRDCVVLSGTVDDVYTGKTIAFERGQKTSSAVQIDHVVALSDAWQKGAQQLSTEERTDFANDPRNLQAVDGPTNQQKGDGDAATWLPPNRSYRCTYVSRQIEVKSAYRLWVTAAEKQAMQRLLTNCGGTAPTTAEVPETSTETTPVRETPTTAATRRTRVPETTAQAPAGGDVYYKNCSAARAAGAAPLLIGEPGYRPGMDGDGDGIACE